jgi:hypothetical protein
MTGVQAEGWARENRASKAPARRRSTRRPTRRPAQREARQPSRQPAARSRASGWTDASRPAAQTGRQTAPARPSQRSSSQRSSPQRISSKRSSSRCGPGPAARRRRAFEEARSGPGAEAGRPSAHRPRRGPVCRRTFVARTDTPAVSARRRTVPQGSQVGARHCSVFGYGRSLGPAQTAPRSRGPSGTRPDLRRTDGQHVTTVRLESAIEEDVIEKAGPVRIARPPGQPESCHPGQRPCRTRRKQPPRCRPSISSRIGDGEDRRRPLSGAGTALLSRGPDRRPAYP